MQSENSPPRLPGYFSVGKTGMAARQTHSFHCHSSAQSSLQGFVCYCFPFHFEKRIFASLPDPDGLCLVVATDRPTCHLVGGKSDCMNINKFTSLEIRGLSGKPVSGQRERERFVVLWVTPFDKLFNFIYFDARPYFEWCFRSIAGIACRSLAYSQF